MEFQLIIANKEERLPQATPYHAPHVLSVLELNCLTVNTY